MLNRPTFGGHITFRGFSIYEKRLTFRQPSFSLQARFLEPVFGRNGQLLAAMTAAGSQHATTVGGSHTLAETVLVDTLAAGRLECSFHCMSFLLLSSLAKWIAKVVILHGFANFFFTFDE